jgi:micrococcal nuclease
MTHRFLAALLLIAAVAVACEPRGSAGDPHTIPDTPRRALPDCAWADVVAITDGDTIRVELDGAEERVRYIGIDAPEVKPQSGEPDPLADEATEANAFLVEGERICLERDVSERDRFGRLLRYAWLEDGRMVNEALVAAGLAESVAFRPDVRHQDSILDPAEEEARIARRGIWR